MSDEPTLFLMNCRNCEDVQRITEKLRRCECGKTEAVVLKSGAPEVRGVYGRILAMNFEDYDKLAPGEVACLIMIED